MFNNTDKSTTQSFIEFKLKNAEGTELEFKAGGLGEEHYSALIEKIIASNFQTQQNSSIESKRAPEVIPAEKPQPPTRLESTRPIARPFVPAKQLESIPASRVRKTEFVKNDDPKVYSTADNELATTALFTKDELEAMSKHIEVTDLSAKAKEGTEKLFVKKDAVSESDREPDYFKSGIKYKGVDLDKPMYKTSYNCPNCGHSGRHYIPDFAKMVSCHDCHSKLRVESATENGFGVGDAYRDKHGNFFVANTLVIDKQPKYEKSI